MSTKAVCAGFSALTLGVMGLVLVLCQSCATTGHVTPANSQSNEAAILCDPILRQVAEWQAAQASATAEDDKTETRSISLLGELEMGEQYATLLAKRFTAQDSPRLDGILQSLVRFADRPILTYRVKLLETAQINAFSVPGGHLYVTQGLLDAMEPTDGELAFILAHEMAHAALRHLASTMERGFADYNTRIQLCMAAQQGRVDGSSVAPTFQALDFTAFLNCTQGEFQADQFGALYALQAGYQFSEVISALKKMIRAAGDVNEIGTTTVELMGGSIWSLPTHPATSERIDQLERFRNQLTEVAATAEEAVRMLEQRRYADAADAFRTLLKVFPDSRAMRMDLALADHLQFRDSQNDASMTRGTLSNPEKLEVRWTALLTRGTHSSVGDSLAFQRALSGYKYTLALDPNHSPARNNLAVAYLDRGDYERAISELKTVLAADKAYAPAYRNLAIAHLARFQSSMLAAGSPQARLLVREIQGSWDEYKTRMNGQLGGEDQRLDAHISQLTL